MPARISISTEEGLCLETQLGSQPFRIGRAKDNSLRSEDRRTSRHHAVVRKLDEDTYEIEDAGSSYGTILNGRPITKEKLKHQDIVRCGGLTLQFTTDAGPDDAADPSIMTATLDNLFEVRTQIRRLIEEQAALRSEVGIAQEAEDRAKRLRDEAQDEVERLHGIISELRKENAGLDHKIDELGRELRERLATKSDVSPDVEALRQQLADAQKQSERHKSRAVELEEREAVRVAVLTQAAADVAAERIRAVQRPAPSALGGRAVDGDACSTHPAVPAP